MPKRAQNGSAYRIDSIRAGNYGSAVRVFRIRPDGPFYSEVQRIVGVIELPSGGRIYDLDKARRWAELASDELAGGGSETRIEFEESIQGPAPQLIKQSKPRWLYFIQCEVTHRIKIGVSSNPKERLASLQVGCPTPLRLVAAVKGAGHNEWAQHRRFSEYRVHGEWFEPHSDLLDHIRSIRKEVWCYHLPKPLEPECPFVLEEEAP